MPKRTETFRLSEDARSIIAESHSLLGLNRSATVELALRRLKEKDLKPQNGAKPCPTTR